MEYNFKKTGNPKIDAHIHAQESGLSAGQINIKQAHDILFDKEKLHDEINCCLFPILNTDVESSFSDNQIHNELINKFSLDMKTARKYFSDDSNTISHWAYTMLVINNLMEKHKLKAILADDASLMLKSYRLAFLIFIENQESILLTNFFMQTTNIAKLALNEIDIDILLSIYKEKDEILARAEAEEK